MYGKLYGLGVGPGAPDLLTLRAAKILGQVDVVLAAASPRNTYSTALEIAMPHVHANASIERLEFPMTHDKNALQAAWHKAAKKSLALLEQGKNCAFITLGDPLIYSTFVYLMRTLKSYNDQIEIEIVSGITSFQAAAARTATVLCEAHENLLILPGINGGEKLAKGLEIADNAVILKAYKNFPAIVQALQNANCVQNSLLASHICQDEEQVCLDIQDIKDVPPYLSLILT